jgi:hypothetical protein
MSTRAWWIVVGATALLAVGVAVSAMDPSVTSDRDVFVHSDEPGTWWELEPGGSITLPADVFNTNDRYRCPGHPPVLFTPQPGTGTTFSEDHGLWVATADDLTVMAGCAPASPP